MADRSLIDLHPHLAVLLTKWEEATNATIAPYEVGVSQTWRSWAEQDADYAQGRTTPGHIITNARGGESPHNCTDDGTATGKPAAKAFDFFIIGPNSQLDWNAGHPCWQRAIAIGESLGLVSGSEFHSIHDGPHFELPNWKA